MSDEIFLERLKASVRGERTGPPARSPDVDPSHTWDREGAYARCTRCGAYANLGSGFMPCGAAKSAALQAERASLTPQAAAVESAMAEQQSALVARIGSEAQRAALDKLNSTTPKELQDLLAAVEACLPRLRHYTEDLSQEPAIGSWEAYKALPALAARARAALAPQP